MSKLNKKEKDTNEDIVYAVEGADQISSVEKKIKKVKEDLKKCQEEKQEYLDGWQRSKADFVNLKKRLELEKLDFVKYANQELLLEIIPALDSFDQAFKNKESWEKVSSDWRTGVEFIYSQLQKVLEEHNVMIVNPLGEKFDAKLHHSMETIEVEDREDDGKIVDVIQMGYKFEGKIIRYPNVKVGALKDK